MDVGSAVSDVVFNRSGDSDVRMGGGFGVNEGVFFDDGGDGSDVDAFGERLELDGDGDIVSCGESSEEAGGSVFSPRHCSSKQDRTHL